MDAPAHPRRDADSPEPEQMSGCLVRLFWLILGNAILLLLAALIYRDARPMWSPISIGYWLVVGAIMIARYVDITRLRGLTTDGKPATVADFRAFWPKLTLAAGALWGAAHLL